LIEVVILKGLIVSYGYYSIIFGIRRNYPLGAPQTEVG